MHLQDDVSRDELEQLEQRFQLLRHELWWFPYRPGGYRRFLGLMRAL